MARMFLRFYLFLLLVVVTIVMPCNAQDSRPNLELDSTQLNEFYNYIKWTYNYGTQKEFDSTARYSKRAMQLAQKLQNEDLIAYAKINASQSLYWQLKTKAARVLLKENIQHERLHDSIRFQTYLLIGEIELYERQFKDVVSYLVEAEKLLEKKNIITKRDSLDVVLLSLSLAELHKGLNNYEKAHFYYDRSFDFYGNKNESSYVLYHKSDLFQKQNEIESAITVLKNALKLIDKGPEGKLFLPTYCLKLSELYLNLEQPDSALFYAKQGLLKNENCKLDLLNKASGDACLLVNNYKKAFYYYDKALSFSDSKDFEMTIHENLRDVHTKLKNFKKALVHNELFLQLKDSINDLKVKQEVTEITEKYESNKKQFEIEKLKTEDLQNQSVIHKQKERIKLISFGLLASIVILGLIFYGYINQKRQRHLLFTKNVQLAKELNENVEIQNETHPIEIIDSKRDKIQLDIELLISKEFYLDQDMSLSKMAKLIQTNTTYLSKIINAHYDRPFSTFINDLRISYTLRNLESQPDFRKLTIEHIAEKSGFSSTSAFYKAFKKSTGLTPSYYIKKRISE